MLSQFYIPLLILCCFISARQQLEIGLSKVQHNHEIRKPLLFIMYINDIATVVSPESEINMFADDIALYRVIKASVDYLALQDDIDSIGTVVANKHLEFNTDKC